jgi:hypothetical protein
VHPKMLSWQPPARSVRAHRVPRDPGLLLLYCVLRCVHPNGLGCTHPWSLNPPPRTELGLELWVAVEELAHVRLVGPDRLVLCV